MATRPGALRLFEVSGITVFLHFTWFLVAIFEVGGPSRRYSSILWSVLEYLGLFAIVTLHEFGHAFACRSVGGRATEIMLWPLGGIAYVDPPSRPGATLWSIAAGPLVNVALVPVLIGALVVMPAGSEIRLLLRSLAVINMGLLFFNMLPVYPLDGGQILRALLWFAIGRLRSLVAAATIGLVLVACLAGLALWNGSLWLLLILVFLGLQCIRSIKLVRNARLLTNAPRREGFACPNCGEAPPVGEFWTCRHCQTPYDPFRANELAGAHSSTVSLNLAADVPTTDPRADDPTCPSCREIVPDVACFNCWKLEPFSRWITGRATTDTTVVSDGVTRTAAVLGR